jgi:hypothetical protein
VAEGEVVVAAAVAASSAFRRRHSTFVAAVLATTATIPGVKVTKHFYFVTDGKIS